MARLPLVGQYSAARSLTASAQTCTNLYAEPTADPNEKAKGIGALYGLPGRHLFKDLTLIDAAATPIRCTFSAGGRFWAAAGPRYMELDSSGTLVGSVRTIADDGVHSPVQMFVNGTQLFIVSAGRAYIDNGAGPTLITFPGSTYYDLSIGYSGTVDTVDVTGAGYNILQRVDGDFFNVGMEGHAISVNSIFYTVARVSRDNGCETTPQVPTGSNLPWFLGQVNVVTSAAQPFGPEDVGASLTVTSGAGFFIQTVTILSVDGLGNATCSAAMGTIGSKNGQAQESFPFTALTGAFLDGYFIVNAPSTNKFYISGLNNGNTWRALDVGVKESSPDNIRGILVNNEQLYLFGTDTFEAWQNTGGSSLVAGIAPFPLERINGATQHFGNISSWGPLALDGRVYFLGGNDQGQIVAYVLNGFTPVRISTYAEESAWNAAGPPTNVYSYGYLEEGHSFWVFHIGATAWGFDTTTGAWHQRAVGPPTAFATYQTYFHTFVPEFGGTGKHLTGGIFDGKVYESSVNFYDDNGQDIGWERALPYNYGTGGGNRQYYGRMTLETQAGTVSSGAAPLITRDYSDDRGNTFVNPQTASLGVHNDWSLRVYWPVGGSSRDRVWRFRGVGREKVALIDLDLDITQGVN